MIKAHFILIGRATVTDEMQSYGKATFL